MDSSIKWTLRKVELQLQGYSATVIKQIIDDEQLAQYRAGQTPAVVTAAPTEAAPKSDPPWMEIARIEARHIRKERVAKGWFPNLLVLAEEVAKLFNERGITGPNGHALSADTIKRHALQGYGITNDAAKLRQTLNKRGK
jgi:hypothetical protein